MKLDMLLQPPAGVSKPRAQPVRRLTFESVTLTMWVLKNPLVLLQKNSESRFVQRQQRKNDTPRLQV